MKLFELVMVMVGVFAGPLLACVALSVTQVRCSALGISVGMIVGCAAAMAATRTSLAGLWIAPLAVIITTVVALAISVLDTGRSRRPRAFVEVVPAPPEQTGRVM